MIEKKYCTVPYPLPHWACRATMRSARHQMRGVPLRSSPIATASGLRHSIHAIHCICTSIACELWLSFHGRNASVFPTHGHHVARVARWFLLHASNYQCSPAAEDVSYSRMPGFHCFWRRRPEVRHALGTQQLTNTDSASHTHSPVSAGIPVPSHSTHTLPAAPHSPTHTALQVTGNAVQLSPTW